MTFATERGTLTGVRDAAHPTILFILCQEFFKLTAYHF
jgi:hypothetical protein